MARRKNDTFQVLWGLLVGFPLAIGLWLGYKITHSAISATVIAVIWAGIGIVILLMMRFAPKVKPMRSSSRRTNTEVHQSTATVESTQRMVGRAQAKKIGDSTLRVPGNKDELTPRKTVDPTRIGDIGEYKLDVQLRQMSNDRRYLNDVMIPYSRSRTGYSQIDHILITQYGLFVIEMKNYSGKIKGKAADKNWWVNGRFPMYNPIRQNRMHIRALQAILRNYRGLKFVSVVVFTKRCALYLDDNELRNPESDEFVIADIRFTDCIETKLRKLKRENSVQPLSESDVLRIFELIQSKNITDPKIRAEHKEKANQIKLSTEKDTQK
ncbi:MAG: NERD domain-containing protein [Alicyclobacillus sp.]|nr:NERD domain-containing protein [Alicyclobacillus sp.]